MFAQLVRKEILDHLMSLRFAIACVLCFIVILSSLFVRCRDYIQSSDDYHEYRAMEAARRRRMSHPWYIVWEGVNVHQAPNPMKIFVRGTDEGGGASVRLGTIEEPSLVASDVQNPAAFLFPAMDMISFVGVIMSLLAVVFGYDAICGEKERGTLRLVLSYSIPRDTVLLGKWIGGYVALVVPFLLSVIAGATIVLVQPSISLTGAQWAQFAGISALALLYVAAVYSAALYVSCLTSKSSTSIMILVTIWMVVVLVIPNLSPYLAQAWLPTRNLADVQTAKETAASEIEQRWEAEIEAKMEVYDAEHGFERGRPWHEGFDWRNREHRKKLRKRQLYERQFELKSQLERMGALAEISRDFERRLDAQVSLSKWISRVSPFSSFAMAVTELTGTGMLGKRRFLEQIRGHQAVLTRYAYAEWDALARQEIATGRRPPSWAEAGNRTKRIPVFRYVPPAAGDYVKAVAVDAAILVGAAVLFFMLSYVTFRRYDVR